jgi:hypothetical protein
MQNFNGTNDLDYINILQCYYGYQLLEPGEVNAASEEVSSQISELTLQNLSSDSLEQQQPELVQASEEENVL